MKWVLLVLATAAGLAACKGAEYTGSRVVTLEGGEKITFAARSMDDTSIVTAARAIGWETRRGAVLSMTVDSRPAILLEKLTDADEPLSQADVDAVLAGIRARLSPDGQHLVVSWKIGPPRTALYHLLPHGCPFQLELPGKEFPVGLDIDFSKVPSSLALAREALAIAAREPEYGDVPGGRYFWEALQDGAAGTDLEGPLLALWPVCWRAVLAVANMTRNSEHLSAGWRQKLKAKTDAVLAAGKPLKDLKTTFNLCLFIGDSACAEAAAGKLVPAWPEDEYAAEAVQDSFDKLPKTLREAVIAKAMGDRLAYPSPVQDRIYRAMKKWADCDTWRTFAANYLSFPQQRDDCPGWPLKRFPDDAEALQRVRALVAAGEKGKAIRLVRKTTGWQDSQAAEFVEFVEHQGGK